MISVAAKPLSEIHSLGLGTAAKLVLGVTLLNELPGSRELQHSCLTILLSGIMLKERGGWQSSASQSNRSAAGATALPRLTKWDSTLHPPKELQCAYAFCPRL